MNRFVFIRAKEEGNHCILVKTSQHCGMINLFSCNILLFIIISGDPIDLHLFEYCFLMHVLNYAVVQCKESLE